MDVKLSSVNLTDIMSTYVFQLKQPKAAINIIEKLFKIIEPLGK